MALPSHDETLPSYDEAMRRDKPDDIYNLFDKLNDEFSTCLYCVKSLHNANYQGDIPKVREYQLLYRDSKDRLEKLNMDWETLKHKYGKDFPRRYLHFSWNFKEIIVMEDQANMQLERSVQRFAHRVWSWGIKSSSSNA